MGPPRGLNSGQRGLIAPKDESSPPPGCLSTVLSGSTHAPAYRGAGSQGCQFSPSFPMPSPPFPGLALSAPPSPPQIQDSIYPLQLVLQSESWVNVPTHQPSVCPKNKLCSPLPHLHTMYWGQECTGCFQLPGTRPDILILEIVLWSQAPTVARCLLIKELFL